jgi:hypothetical protein
VFLVVNPVIRGLEPIQPPVDPPLRPYKAQQSLAVVDPMVTLHAVKTHRSSPVVRRRPATYPTRSQESNVGGSKKKSSFLVHLGRTKNKRGRRRQHAWQLGVGRRQLLPATGGDAASDVSMSYLRFLLALCCCRAVCDDARAESVRCVLDEKPNSQGDEEAHCGRNKITEYGCSSSHIPPNWAAGFSIIGSKCYLKRGLRTKGGQSL